MSHDVMFLFVLVGQKGRVDFLSIVFSLAKVFPCLPQHRGYSNSNPSATLRFCLRVRHSTTLLCLAFLTHDQQNFHHGFGETTKPKPDGEITKGKTTDRETLNPPMSGQRPATLSSTASPPIVPHDTIKLFCYIIGSKGDPFPVTIDRSATVQELKEGLMA